VAEEQELIKEEGDVLRLRIEDGLVVEEEGYPSPLVDEAGIDKRIRKEGGICQQ
jgi:hypothetical protein